MEDMRILASSETLLHKVHRLWITGESGGNQITQVSYNAIGNLD